MNEHQFDLNVSFRLNNILEINNHHLETADLTPVALGDIVSYVDDDIKQHLSDLENFDTQYRPTSSRFLRPVILVARLALFDQQYDALTNKTLISGQRHITHASLLTEEAFEYWNSIDKDEYQPQVHVLSGTDKASSGVWLGISERY
ncbi:MAG TPA: hypothetical protein VIM31_02265 [Candidatus Microsaccharimonas sp.]|jgi:hypothetical protein